MISVIEGVFDPRPIPEGHECLYVRRKSLFNGGYKEYAYVGPAEEVQALAERCLNVDMEKVDELLRIGLSFEDALTKLGIP